MSANDIEGKAILSATLKAIAARYNLAKKTNKIVALADFVVAHDAAFEIYLRDKPGRPVHGIENPAYHHFISSRD